MEDTENSVASHHPSFGVIVWTYLRIGARLNTRDQVRGRESDLLDLGKVVLRVLVQNNLANRAKGELPVRPNLGKIEDVVSELLSLLRRHGLLSIRCLSSMTLQSSAAIVHTHDIDSPRRTFTLFNVVEETLNAVIGIGSTELAGFRVAQGLETPVCADVDLDIVEFALSINEFEGVSRVAVHVVVSVRSSAVRKQDDDLVDRLWALTKIVP